MAEHDKAGDRPIVLVLFSVMLFALGIVMILLAIHAIVSGSDTNLDYILVLASLDVMIAAIMSVIFAILLFVIGLGLWNLRGWSKSILMVFTGLGVVIFPLKGLLMASSMSDSEYEITTSDLISVVMTIIGIIVAIAVLWFLSRPNIILSFEAKEMTVIKKRIRALEEKIEIGRQQCNAGEMTKAELSKLRADCVAEERLLRGRIRHYEKLRLSRERKLKEKKEKKKEARKEKEAKKEEKKAEKEEKRAEKEKEEEEEEEGEAEEEEEEPEEEEGEAEEEAKEKAGEGEKEKHTKKRRKKKAKKENEEEEGEGEEE